MHNRPNAHIQIRAYYIWENEGRPHGCHETHWHQAEKEIYAEQGILPTTPKAKAAKESSAPKAAAAKPASKKAPAKKPQPAKKTTPKKVSKPKK